MDARTLPEGRKLDAVTRRGGGRSLLEEAQFLLTSEFWEEGAKRASLCLRTGLGFFFPLLRNGIPGKIGLLLRPVREDLSLGPDPFSGILTDSRWRGLHGIGLFDTEALVRFPGMMVLFISGLNSVSGYFDFSSWVLRGWECDPSIRTFPLPLHSCNEPFQ